MLLLSCSFKKWDDPVLVLFCCRLQQLFYHHPDPAETSSGHFLKHSTTWTISCVKMRQQQLEKKPPHVPVSTQTKVHGRVSTQCCVQTHTMQQILLINTTLPPCGEIWHAHQAHHRTCLCYMCNHLY